MYGCNCSFDKAYRGTAKKRSKLRGGRWTGPPSIHQIIDACSSLRRVLRLGNDGCDPAHGRPSSPSLLGPARPSSTVLNWIAVKNGRGPRESRRSCFGRDRLGSLYITPRRVDNSRIDPTIIERREAEKTRETRELAMQSTGTTETRSNFVVSGENEKPCPGIRDYSLEHATKTYGVQMISWLGRKVVRRTEK